MLGLVLSLVLGLAVVGLVMRALRGKISRPIDYLGNPRY
jgi:hypothetical protein